MTTTSVIPDRRTARPFILGLGAVAGTALVVAGVWSVLFQQHVTSPKPPAYPVGATPEQAQHTYYAWYAGTVPQERVLTIIALVGVFGLILMAQALRHRVAEHDLASLASTTIGLGGLVWLSGALVGVGGHRAVAAMATHGNALEGVNSIAFTLDTVVNAFSAAAFILLGAAMIALGVSRARPSGPAWSTLTILTGATSLTVAIGFTQSVDSLTTDLLDVLAAVLLPAWLVLTGRVLDVQE
jgi:hypothetical protein